MLRILGCFSMLLMLATACSQNGGGDQAARRGDSTAVRPIDSVLATHTDHLMSLPGVVGVGIGECDARPCIKVLAAQSSDELTRQLPDSLEGYAVRVEVTGEFKANDSVRQDSGI